MTSLVARVLPEEIARDVSPRWGRLSAALIVWSWLGIGSVLAQDIEVRSFLDRSRVAIGEQFTLSVEISGRQANTAEPEAPQLGEFATPLGSGTSSQIQLVNGQMSVSRTINYYFQASREGEFEIPAIPVRTPNGTVATEPLTVLVDRSSTRSAPPVPPRGNSPAASDVSAGELFVEASANKLRVYQGEAVVVTYDILTLVNVSSYSLVDLPSTQGFWVEEYPIEQPQTRNEVVDGRRYTVATIKQMALLPTSPGTKTIEPLVVECEVRVRRRGDIFDDFFGDRMGRNSQRRRVASQPLEIEVRPLPEVGRPENFSGGVGKFSIEAKVDKNRVEANQAVTLSLKIKGAGNITSISDPVVQFPKGFEIYPPESKTQTRRRSDGIQGEKTLDYVVVPRSSGKFEIPPVEFAYFDPADETYRTIRTEPIPIEVTASADMSRSVDPTISKKQVELLSEDIRFLKPSTTLQRRHQSLIQPWTLLLSLLSPLLLLAGAFLLNRHREKLSSDRGYARLRRSRKLAQRRLSEARKLLGGESQSDFYSEIDRALAGFVGDRLNLAEAGLIWSQLQALLLERGVPETVVTGYLDCLKLCQQKRFAPISDTLAERSESLKRVETAISQLERALESTAKGALKR